MDAASDGLVSNRFALGGLLGTGGSASVFEALDNATGQAVALKVLHPHLSQSAAAREAFFAEAAAASALAHPNIVAVLGFGVHGTGAEALAWIALELAPGVPLAEYVEHHGALDVPAALALADGVLRALEAAHRQGVMHRDISAANVMVAFDENGTLSPEGVRLVDFGLADAAGRPALGTDILRSRSADAPPDALGVLGSANFMSPEQALGMPVDERGDLYQVGALLHFALTARPPFVRPTVTGVMRAHVSSPPPVPSVLNRAVPRQLDRLVVRALVKDAAGRFASAAEMREEVRSIEARRAARAAAVASSRVPARQPSASQPPTVRLTPAPPDVRGLSVGGNPPAAAASATSYEDVDAVAAARSAPSRGRSAARGSVLAVTVLTVTVIAVAWVLSLGAGSSTPRADAVTGTSASTAAVVTADPGASGAQSEAPAAPSPPPSTSAAPDLVAVPVLTGLGLADARQRLRVAGLSLGILTPRQAPAGTDIVLFSSPEAGLSVAIGATVDLDVASGTNFVPVVAGLGRNNAIPALEAAGFTVLVSPRTDPSVAPGTAISTDPVAGTELRLGATVTLIVAALPAPPTATPTPTAPGSTPTVTPGPTPGSTRAPTRSGG